MNADEIRAARIRLGLSADQAAVRAGVSPVTWLRAEHGKAIREMSMHKVVSFLEAAAPSDGPPADVLEVGGLVFSMEHGQLRFWRASDPVLGYGLGLQLDELGALAAWLNDHAEAGAR